MSDLPDSNIMPCTSLEGLCQFSLDPEHPYFLGSHIVARVGGLLRKCGHAKAMVLVDSQVLARHRDYIESGLQGIAYSLFEVPSGEASKCIDTVAEVHRRLLAFEADRRTAVVGLGGGVVGDIAGFASATYMRGLPLYLVPTTLLAMVDASIGGKNGVDLPEGKNLIGTFHRPRAVWADLDFLTTLPFNEWGNGLVETLKTAIIGDATLFALLETLDLDAVRKRHFTSLPDLRYHPIFEIIKRAVEVKSQIVVCDYREHGERFKLNLGHTLGHGLETAGGFSLLSHGQAVALGLLAALHMASKRGMLEDNLLDRVKSLLQCWQIPTRIPVQISWDEVSQAMKRDKKRQDGQLVVVLPYGLGLVVVEKGLDESELRQAFEALHEK